MQQILWLVIGGEYWIDCSGVGSQSPTNTRLKESDDLTTARTCPSGRANILSFMDSIWPWASYPHCQPHLGINVLTFSVPGTVVSPEAAEKLERDPERQQAEPLRTLPPQLPCRSALLTNSTRPAWPGSSECADESVAAE